MRKSGNRSKYSKELLEDLVAEYLKTYKTAKEVGEEFGVPEHVVRYHATKERKRLEIEKTEQQSERIY